MESCFADGSPASLLLLSTLFLLASGPFRQTAAPSLRRMTSPGCMPTSSSALSKTQGKISGPYRLLRRGGSYRVAYFTPKVVLVCMRNQDSCYGEGIRRDFTTGTVRRAGSAWAGMWLGFIIFPMFLTRTANPVKVSAVLGADMGADTEAEVVLPWLKLMFFKQKLNYEPDKFTKIMRIFVEIGCIKDWGVIFWLKRIEQIFPTLQSSREI